MASVRVRHHLVCRPTGRADPPLRNPIGDIRYARRGPGFGAVANSARCPVEAPGSYFMHSHCGAVGMLEEGDMKVGGVWDLRAGGMIRWRR